MDYPSIRLYYPGGKAGSFGSLARGYMAAFRDLGIRYAALDYRTPPDEDGFGSEGATYDIGIYVGEPTHLELLNMHARHKERFLVLAPNGYGVRPEILSACKRVGAKPLAPSSWAADVIEYQSGERPEVAHHGVLLVEPSGSKLDRAKEGLDCFMLDRWRDIQDGKRGEKMSLVHFTSTATDRKGTMSILKAMDDLGMSDLCSLEIKCDPHVAPAIRDIVSKLKLRSRREIVVNDQSIPNDGALASYIDSFDAVLQPSRAEGFGLVPLEAASIGVPSVLTRYTGHRDFFDDLSGNEMVVGCPRSKDDCVKFSEDSDEWYCHIEGEEFYGVEMRPDDVFSGVLWMRDNLVEDNQSAIANACRIRQEWSWTSVVKKWLKNR